MRLLEWWFALSFVPILTVPFIPKRKLVSWRRRWLALFVPLPLVMGMLQASVEGWRAQLIPLYGLALLMVIGRLPALLGREGCVRRGCGVLISGVSILAVVGAVALANWLLPVAQMPLPTGPYPVGIVDREVVDHLRERRLMLSIWYPATQHGAPAPLTHDPHEVASALGRLAGLPGWPFQHLRYITLDASERVPVLADGAPFPLLVFSHGLVGLRLQNSPMLQELASWGYVIVALDHTDAAAVTRFPDGETRYYDLAHFGITAADGEPDHALMDARVFPVWVADQQFVLDVATQWAVDDPLLAGKIDLSRIGSFGHSFGGATALEVCRVDARCRAAVNLDGGLYGELVNERAVRPLLLVSSATSGGLPETMAKWQRMIDNARAPAYWFELVGSNHYSFTLLPLLSPLLAPMGFDVRAGLHTTDTYVRSFFDAHLRDRDAAWLKLTLGNEQAGADEVRWMAR